MNLQDSIICSSRGRGCEGLVGGVMGKGGEIG